MYGVFSNMFDFWAKSSMNSGTPQWHPSVAPLSGTPQWQPLGWERGLKNFTL